jgi:hypothetical protein
MNAHPQAHRRGLHAALALPVVFSAAACDPQGNAVEDRGRNRVSELPQPRHQRGWRYDSSEDRIRRALDRRASLINEDPDDITQDQTVMLQLQLLGDGSSDVAFRPVPPNMMHCYTPCAVRFRAGERTGAWLAHRSDTSGTLTIAFPRHALATIRSSPTLIVELPNEAGGQHSFNTAGLQWPDLPPEGPDLTDVILNRAGL